MRGYIAIGLGFCLALASAAAHASDWYVDATYGDDSNPGTSWGSAFATLQEALLDHAGTGDTVHVAEGTYYPDEGGTGNPGNRNSTFALLNGMTLLGGYPAGGGTRDPDNNVTILNGDIDDDGLDDGNTYHVVKMAFLGSTTTLDGFTITMGYADTNSGLDRHGAGVFVRDSEDVVISDCTIVENYAHSQGGGVWIYQPSNAPATSQTTITDCVFEDNECDDAGAGLGYFNEEGAGHDLTVTDCYFEGNRAEDAVDPAAGGAIEINGTDQTTISGCDFIDNFASNYGGAIRAVTDANTGVEVQYVEITDCTFDGNRADTHNGGAVFIYDVRETFIEECSFVENESLLGGGAIWVLATKSNTAQRHVIFNVDDCDFVGNFMEDTSSTTDGGGAIFLSGNANSGTYAGVITGTISNCDFIGNTARRGGAMYVHSCGGVVDSVALPFHITGCRFIANGTEADCVAGGGIGLSNKSGLTGSDVRICKSTFVSNESWRGGAVHNHEDALTYMVNCVLTGNTSAIEGGGVFNSKHTSGTSATLNMHNCLIAGNVAGTDGGGVYNGLSGDNASMELIQCTLVGNYAEDEYGGAVSVSGEGGCRMYVKNTITRGNDSYSIGDAFKNQMYHVGNYEDDPPDADNFVADGTLPAIYEPSMNPPTWTASDPVFTEDGSSTVVWTYSTYDPDTGETTFSTSDPGVAAPGMLFQPDGVDTPMLIISTVGNSSFVCTGWRADTITTVSITGKLYDLHIDSSGSAYNFGGDYLPEDVCDVDGDMDTGEDLPLDLFGNSREQSTAPDAGVHEVTPP